MRYAISLHPEDECTFAGMLKSTPFTYRIIGRCILTGAIEAVVELPGEQSELSFLAGLLRLARSQTWHNSDWVKTHERAYARELERAYARELEQYGESPVKFLERFSKEMEAASKKILKEEEEQKAKEQEEQRAKEEEDRKLKEIKDEEDAKLTALISYFYNRN